MVRIRSTEDYMKKKGNKGIYSRSTRALKGKLFIVEDCPCPICRKNDKAFQTLEQSVRSVKAYKCTKCKAEYDATGKRIDI